VHKYTRNSNVQIYIHSLEAMPRASSRQVERTMHQGSLQSFRPGVGGGKLLGFAFVIQHGVVSSLNTSSTPATRRPAR